VKFFPLTCYLVPLRPKYSPQHPILKHPQPTFLPQCQRPSFTHVQKTGKILVLYILIFTAIDLPFHFLRNSVRKECLCHLLLHVPATVSSIDDRCAVTVRVGYVRSVFGVGPSGITQIYRSFGQCRSFHLQVNGSDSDVESHRTDSGQCMGGRLFEWSALPLPP
jgi:hypothetical protein